MDHLDILENKSVHILREAYSMHRFPSSLYASLSM